MHNLSLFADNNLESLFLCDWQVQMSYFLNLSRKELPFAYLFFSDDVVYIGITDLNKG